MTVAYAAVRGAKLAYERSGGGPTFIWGHGLSQTMDLDARSRLIDWTHVPVRVIRYDARGHGLSETTADLDGYSWAEMAADQLALATVVGVDRYICGGASMGCGTALNVAVQAPERLRGLVLVIPPTAWEGRAGQADVWEASARTIETEGVDALIAARAAMPVPDPFVPYAEQRKELQAEGTRSWDPKRLAHVMRGATRANLPERDVLRTVATPTLILAWTGDAVHPMSTAEELAALLPNNTMSVASTLADVNTWSAKVADFVRSLG